MTVARTDSVRGKGDAVAEELVALHALGPVGRAVAGRSGGFARGPRAGDGPHGRGATRRPEPGLRALRETGFDAFSGARRCSFQRRDGRSASRAGHAAKTGSDACGAGLTEGAEAVSGSSSPRSGCTT